MRSSNLARSSFEEECLSPESMRGAPRYLKGTVAILKFRMWEILHWVGRGVLKKKISSFSWLMVMPEALEKVERMLLKVLDSWIEGCPMRRLLSKNC